MFRYLSITNSAVIAALLKKNRDKMLGKFVDKYLECLYVSILLLCLSAIFIYIYINMVCIYFEYLT